MKMNNTAGPSLHIYFQTRHADNDWITKSFDTIINHLNESGDKDLKDYVSRYREVFPDLFTKKKLPLSTSCCWTQLKMSKFWTHRQYFVLLDLMLSFNISTEIFSPECNQACGTFFGGLVNHLTSRSLWISADGKYATTVCPEDGVSNAAWGEYKSKKNPPPPTQHIAVIG